MTTQGTGGNVGSGSPLAHLGVKEYDDGPVTWGGGDRAVVWAFA
ncbi:hypothetical protein [Arthrobacter sp. M4]|nr:hypothetical protein [Arthrobacter sp. M4]